MDTLLKFAQDAGMSESQGETATGGLFSFLKDNMSKEQYSQVQGQLPGVDGAVDRYSAPAEGGGGGGGMGGMLGSAMSSLGGGGGGGAGGSAGAGLPGLLAALASKGIDPAMMKKYMPQVVALVKTKCGVDLSQYLGGIGGGTAAGGTAGQAPASSSSGGASNMMGQAMGMFGK